MRTHTIFLEFQAAFDHATRITHLEDRATYIFRGDPKLGDYYLFSRSQHLPEPGAAYMLSLDPGDFSPRGLI